MLHKFQEKTWNSSYILYGAKVVLIKNYKLNRRIENTQ